MGSRRSAQQGQAIVIAAIATAALCGMLALAVDMGLTAARYQMLRNTADSAAYTAARTLYGRAIGRITASDGTVWNVISGTLGQANLNVINTSGSAAAPSDPCAAGYAIGQVALRATYLDRQNTPIAGSIALATSTPPAGASGVLISVGACQPAAFGGVLGHPRYTLWVDSSAGPPYQGVPTNTPTAVPTIATFAYGVSAAPNGDCSNDSPPATDSIPTATPAPATPPVTSIASTTDEYYCKAVYNIGSAITFYATGGGSGNVYGNNSSFKGYVGAGPYNIDQEYVVPSGNSAHGPGCPSVIRVPLITGVHSGSIGEYFVIEGFAVVNVNQCGNPSIGTIQQVLPGDDPHGIIAAATALPTATPPPIVPVIHHH